MHSAFRNGFEKSAYDYTWEKKELERERASRQYDTPMGYGKGIGVGALLGGAAGGLIGSVMRNVPPVAGGLTGLGIGALVGGGIGALVARNDERDIEDAQAVMQMDPTERAELMASRARTEEVLSNRAHDRALHHTRPIYTYSW